MKPASVLLKVAGESLKLPTMSVTARHSFLLEETFSPEEFVSLTERHSDAIESVRFEPPEFGGESTGRFFVVFRPGKRSKLGFASAKKRWYQRKLGFAK